MMDCIFRCPICKAPLNDTDFALKCGNSHSFDKAAKGYVHLLPPHKMHTKLPGDNREMVAARRRFLDAGFYHPFRQRICALIADELQNRTAPLLIDAGCGEGYYTDAIGHTLASICQSPVICGLDISKLAIKAAANRSRMLHLAVASCFEMPLQNACADVLLNVFAPIVPSEFARVLKPNGMMLLAVASPKHLLGLKQLLYETPYLNAHQETTYPGFTFETRVPIRSHAVLTDKNLIADLFAMTPYYWKTSIAGSQRLQQTNHLETELGFDLLIYRRQE
ncbi:MAG: putative RNA methyltransferase [Candidatus Fimivivens sp.]